MKKMNPGLKAMLAKKDMPMKKETMMKKGGMAHSDMAKDKPMMKKVAKAEVKGHEKKMHGMKKGGVACAPKKMAMGGMAYAKGGGCEVKGKTKGKMIKMKNGGAC